MVNAQHSCLHTKNTPTELAWARRGRNATSFLMGMLANGMAGSRLFCRQPKILPSSSGLNLTPGLAGVSLCVKFRVFQKQQLVKLCPIRTGLAEVSVTRVRLGINILSVVL